jgi:hypothetical protein
MAKGFDEFGGWLKVFFVVTGARALLLAIGMVPTLYAVREVSRIFDSGNLPVKAWPSLGPTFINIAGLFALLSVFLVMLVIMRKRETFIPTQVSILLIVVFLIFGMLQVVETVWPSIGFPNGKKTSFFTGLLNGAAWPAVWLLYFRVSRRVRRYYGSNSFGYVAEAST